MRVTRYKTTQAEEAIITGLSSEIQTAYNSAPAVDKGIVVIEDVLRDAACVISGSLSLDMMDFNEVFTEAQKVQASVGTRVSAEYVIDRLFMLRRDLVQFSECEACKGIVADQGMDHSSKCQQVFRMLVEVFSSYYSSGASGSSSQTPATGTPISFYTNILTAVLPPAPTGSTTGDADADVASTADGYTHSGNDKFQHTTYDYSKSKMTAQEILKLAEKIINECPEVFNLAANFLTALAEADQEREDTDAGQMSRKRKMLHHSEMGRIDKGELLKPEEVVDRNIMLKKVKVTQYQDMQTEDQCLYVALDVSGSMQGAPLMCGKALLLALGKNALENGETFMYRLFNDAPSDRKEVSPETWKDFVKDIIATSADGGTNIMTTLRQVANDISTNSMDKEIVLITDATEAIDPAEVQARIPVDTSVLLIANSGSNEQVRKGYERAFKHVFQTQFRTVSEALQNGIQFIRSGGIK